MNNNLVVLCQPDYRKSCGACCGLYNYVDSSRESLVKRLRGRSKRFRELVKDQSDLKLYAEATFACEDFTPRYEVIYCCEYLGFLDEKEKKVGCLLHPMQNNGVDMRAVSFYGQETCAGHICPSHHFIPAHQSQILVKIIDDWYLFGLCLTDIDLVVEYFRLLADKLGEEIKPEAFTDDKLKDVALEYFNWKINWPFRSMEANRLGKYYFDGSQYMISYINYEKLGLKISPFDKIFMSLSSEFANKQEVCQAEELILKNMQQFISTYQKRF